jgi:NADH-quinone oxidoreductase subunit N
MFELPNLAAINPSVALPAISLALGATILLLVDVLIKNKSITVWLAIVGLAVSFVLNLLVYNSGGEAFGGMFVADHFSGFLNLIILLAAFLSILLSVDYLRRTGIDHSEYYPLLLLTTSGAMFMGSANDLVVVFIALELLSFPLYILAAFRYPDLKSEESGMKYFILGAFASAFFVYGAALVYGATGTTNLPEIFQAISTMGSGGSPAFLLLLGVGLILVGLGFKVAVFPFHMWTPDVYEGSPTPVTAFMSVGAKLGGFGALLRIVAVALPAFVLQDGQTQAAWQQTVALIAGLTLILGNVVALSQTNIKRMLAYSSIAHAGYVMMAVAAAGTTGVSDVATQAALIYLLAYMFTNLGAFGIALAIEKDDGSGTSIDDFVGLAKSKPALAAMMAVFMFSLTGFPLTAGFIGKWFVFRASIEAGLIPLAIVGVLTTIVSAFFYIRIIVNMYLREGDGDPAVGATRYVNWAIYAAFAGTVLIGIVPSLATSLSDAVTLAANIIP